jgi:hypothetical protein
MTVRELIEKLSEIPGELPVMASDYEDGNYDVTVVELCEPWSVHPKHVMIR